MTRARDRDRERAGSKRCTQAGGGILQCHAVFSFYADRARGSVIDVGRGLAMHGVLVARAKCLDGLAESSRAQRSGDQRAR